MSKWKNLVVDAGNIPCWEAVLTGTDGKEAGRFTVDRRFGMSLLRFTEGVLRIIGAPVVFLTAYDAHGDRFPIRMPVVADVRAATEDCGSTSLTFMQQMFNDFAASGRWTPTLESLTGDRWTVEFFPVDNAPDAALRESSAVTPAARGSSGPRFRKSFLGGS